MNVLSPEVLEWMVGEKLHSDAVNLKLAEACLPDGYCIAPIMWIPSSYRPMDGQHVAYRFEPFKSYHCGVYDAEFDSVAGRNGFTSWLPEVTAWYGLPEEENNNE